MANLILFDKGSCKVAVDPNEVVEVQPIFPSPGWSLLTMRNKKEHAVIGLLENVVDMLNAAKARK